MLTLTLLLCLCAASLAHAEKVTVGHFSASQLDGWQTKVFSGTTSYRLCPIDEVTALKAESLASASGLFKKVRIDLEQTPYLSWQWRIENRLPPLNEQSKAGNDYAARVYVVVDGGLLFWKTLAINYVWAASSPKDHFWPNAFAGPNAMMLALRSTEDKAATWYGEKRNLKDDFKKLFAKDIRYIDAIALMTDTDNSKGKATSYYGNIYFSDH
ncbi:MAG: DUF3047 domain-containing protein [Deltaproteobacteria bacterium]|nr:DUF3047 domain-containing protein [Candidatus Anaeroferrophillus wilburensis]MBN2888911.1 DUF3047 domain-containing protein [Deltaproteobacteria bacterium]